MSYIMSLTPSLTSAYLHTHTHTHRVSLIRGFPVLEDTHPVTSWTRRFLVKWLLPWTNWEGLCISAFLNVERRICALFSLLPLILLGCQIVYGYREGFVAMEMFHLAWHDIFCPLSQKSSRCFQLAASAWRVTAYSPSDVRSTQFKSNNLSLCSCEKLFYFLSDVGTPLSPSCSVSFSMTQSLLLFFYHSPPSK